MKYRCANLEIINLSLCVVSLSYLIVDEDYRDSGNYRELVARGDIIIPIAILNWDLYHNDVIDSIMSDITGITSDPELTSEELRRFWSVWAMVNKSSLIIDYINCTLED